MEIVCLDTHIIIWGIKEESSAGEEDMIPKTKKFLKWLDNQGIKAMVPSIVLGEILMPVPAGLHATVQNLLSKVFIIAPFDTAAAMCFAKIWQAKQDDGTIQNLQKTLNTTREKIKIDYQIVATAITHGASCVYSGDRNLKKFGEGFIEVKDIPEISEQLKLL